MPVFASVQFSNVVPSETPSWFPLAPMYLLLISSRVTRNHGYISYLLYIESEGRWLIQGFVTLGCGASLFIPVLAAGFGLLEAKKNQNSITVHPVGRRGGAFHSSTGGWDLYLKPVAELPNPWHSPCSCLTVPLGTSMPQELFRCRIFLGNQQELGLEQLGGCRGTQGLAQSLSVCVWRFWGGNLRLGSFWA